MIHVLTSMQSNNIFDFCVWFQMQVTSVKVSGDAKGKANLLPETVAEQKCDDMRPPGVGHFETTAEVITSLPTKIRYSC